MLRRATDKLMSMRIPTLSYIMLKNFDDIKNEDFFQSQELLKGKSICEICINDPYSVTMAVENWEKFSKEQSGSIIHSISSSDKVRKDIFKFVGFHKQILMLQQDFNFVSTIQRGLLQNSIKSLQVILKYIF